MFKYKLPVNYNNLNSRERKIVREQYIEEQDYKCIYCGNDLNSNPPKVLQDLKIDWVLFPKNFLRYPVHLQHNHDTGMTEGAVHSKCNAILWQYHNR